MSKKNLLHLMAILMVTMLSIGFSSCGSDDDREDTNVKSNVDPEGTVVVNIRNEGSRYAANISFGTYIQIIKNSDKSETREIPITGELYITSSNNFEGCSIVSVGAVSGLGKINSIPKNGWTNSAAVVPRCGYILKQEGYGYDWINNELITSRHLVRYVRLYVVDYMTSASSSGIIGATIKYQGDWKSDDSDI